MFWKGKRERNIYFYVYFFFSFHADLQGSPRSKHPLSIGRASRASLLCVLYSSCCCSFLLLRSFSATLLRWRWLSDSVDLREAICSCALQTHGGYKYPGRRPRRWRFKLERNALHWLAYCCIKKLWIGSGKEMERMSVNPIISTVLASTPLPESTILTVRRHYGVLYVVYSRSVSIERFFSFKNERDKRAQLWDASQIDDVILVDLQWSS